MSGGKADNSIVQEWLHSLNLGEYGEAFVDNGYDDLEICKQIGEADLDAIGVSQVTHRIDILGAVRNLREQGATAVYFTLEAPLQQQLNAVGSCSPPPLANSYRQAYPAGAGLPAGTTSAGSPLPSLDEYEEGRIEFTALPKLQLQHSLNEKLVKDGIKLNVAPYSKVDGSRGFLDALGAHYAEELNSALGDVLEQLEVLRNKYISGQLQEVKTLKMNKESKTSSKSNVRHNNGSVFAAGVGKAVKISHNKFGSLRSTSFDDAAITENKKKGGGGLSKLFKFGTKKATGNARNCEPYVDLRHIEQEELYNIAEEDKRVLMLCVKEGKLSMEEAADKARHLEAELLRSSSDISDIGDSGSGKPQGFFKSLRRKKEKNHHHLPDGKVESRSTGNDKLMYLTQFRSTSPEPAIPEHPTAAGAYSSFLPGRQQACTAATATATARHTLHYGHPSFSQSTTALTAFHQNDAKEQHGLVSPQQRLNRGVAQNTDNEPSARFHSGVSTKDPNESNQPMSPEQVRAQEEFSLALSQRADQIIAEAERRLQNQLNGSPASDTSSSSGDSSTPRAASNEGPPPDDLEKDIRTTPVAAGDCSPRPKPRPPQRKDSKLTSQPPAALAASSKVCEVGTEVGSADVTSPAPTKKCQADSQLNNSQDSQSQLETVLDASHDSLGRDSGCYASNENLASKEKSNAVNSSTTATQTDLRHDDNAGSTSSLNTLPSPRVDSGVSSVCGKTCTVSTMTSRSALKGVVPHKKESSSCGSSCSSERVRRDRKKHASPSSSSGSSHRSAAHRKHRRSKSKGDMGPAATLDEARMHRSQSAEHRNVNITAASGEVDTDSKSPQQVAPPPVRKGARIDDMLLSLSAEQNKALNEGVLFSPPINRKTPSTAVIKNLKKGEQQENFVTAKFQSPQVVCAPDKPRTKQLGHHRHQQHAGKNKAHQDLVAIATLVHHKLMDERIDLTLEPYSDLAGHCGIPVSLVERYSEEVMCNVRDMANMLEHTRITMRQDQGLPTVKNEHLAEAKPWANYSSSADWLTFLGLPQYTDSLATAGLSQLEQFAHVQDSDLQEGGVQNTAHRARIMKGVDALQRHLHKFGCLQQFTV